MSFAYWTEPAMYVFATMLGVFALIAGACVISDDHPLPRGIPVKGSTWWKLPLWFWVPVLAVALLPIIVTLAACALVVMTIYGMATTAIEWIGSLGKESNS